MKTPMQQWPSKPLHPSLHDALGDAIRFWEPRRLLYNVALAAVVLAWVAITGWSRVHHHPTFESMLAILVLAVLANLCYCAAYVIDLPVQLSVYGAAWRRRRWWLWLGGSLFAMALAWYWIGDEIFPTLVHNP